MQCTDVWKVSEKGSIRFWRSTTDTASSSGKRKNGDGVEKVPGRPRKLVRTDEDELVSVIINLEKWLFGLTKIDIRQLAYQY